MLHKTLNIRGTLTSLDTPLVMGILNVTPDSFYADSRKQTEVAIEERIQAILSEGGQIIDLGGYSSRPDAAEVSPEEEMKRLAFALKILNTHYPDVTLSVDTFRADVARRCVEEYGVAIINDISGGELDAACTLYNDAYARNSSDDAATYRLCRYNGGDYALFCPESPTAPFVGSERYYIGSRFRFQ